MARPWSAEEDRWMEEHYGRTDIHELAEVFSEEFGHRRTEQAMYVRASKLGLRRPEKPRQRAVRTVRWSQEPEMEAFMLENDRGSVPAIVAKFERKFGFRLSNSQVTSFRTAHGTQSKAGREHAHDWNSCPVGAERTRRGYVYVKVAERPSSPGARDNWKPKQAVVWERAHGTDLPDGMAVVFADRDASNFEPENLVAVPRDMMAQLNGRRGDWFDADSLRACMTLCRIDSKLVDAVCAPRTCSFCGREFVPRTRGSLSAGIATCPDCVDAGHRNTRAAKMGRGTGRDGKRGDARG